MKKRMLGDVEVSAIGMGCMGFSHAEGKQTDIDTAAEVIRKAVDMGYTFFNTGWNYGNVHVRIIMKKYSVKPCPVSVTRW